MQLTSPAFTHMGDIPSRYTCQGEDISPSLRIDGVPGQAATLVLLMDDPDVPDPKAPKRVWDHWVMFNIPRETKDIPEDSYAGRQGMNSGGRVGYGGPCPPIGKHRYFFKLYALDSALDLSEDATKKDVEDAMEGHVLEKAELVGLYEKS